MNAREFVALLRLNPGEVKTELVADLVEDLASQGEALERERDQARRDLDAAIADRNTHHARYIEADGALCAALNERDEARALLVEEQQARHAAGTRVAQLERELAEARAATGELWFYGDASLATAIERKTAKLEEMGLPARETARRKGGAA